MTDDVAARLAGELERRGLAAPARLLADAHRPLAPLIADFGVAIGGLLAAVPGRHAGRLRELAEDEGALDRLLSGLDGARRRDAEPG